MEFTDPVWGEYADTHDFEYGPTLEAEASPIKGGQLSYMEREVYQKRINDLMNAVSTLLDANKAGKHSISNFAT